MQTTQRDNHRRHESITQTQKDAQSTDTQTL